MRSKTIITGDIPLVVHNKTDYTVVMYHDSPVHSPTCDLRLILGGRRLHFRAASIAWRHRKHRRSPRQPLSLFASQRSTCCFQSGAMVRPRGLSNSSSVSSVPDQDQVCCIPPTSPARPWVAPSHPRNGRINSGSLGRNWEHV